MRDIPFPEFRGGDTVLASDFDRLAKTTNNLSSSSTGKGIHSSSESF